MATTLSQASESWRRKPRTCAAPWARARPASGRIAYQPFKFSVLEVDDRSEANGVERGAAYQHTVDFGLRHQSFDIVRLHAAAVENADRAGGVRAELLPHLGA